MFGFTLNNKRLQKNQLKVVKISVPTLNNEQIELMWSLYRKNYGNASKSIFLEDLLEKEFVFYCKDSRSGEFAGFCTATFDQIDFENRKITVFYTGDTMVHPKYWGQRALYHAITGVLLKEKMRHPRNELYWFVVVMGFRTYLSIARNIKNYWPRHDKETPLDIKRLIEKASENRFGSFYSKESGLIEPGNRATPLKPDVAPITAEIEKIPEIKFLLRQNPRYTEGVEMPCLGKIDMDYFLLIIKKSLQKYITSLHL